MEEFYSDNSYRTWKGYRLVGIDGSTVQLPESEAAFVDVRCDNDLRVRGDAFQLSFCIATVISYLLRFKGHGERIHLGAARSNGSVTISIRGPLASISPGEISQYADVEWETQALEDMALGRDVLTEFMSRHGGRFSQMELQDGRLEFGLTIPLAD